MKVYDYFKNYWSNLGGVFATDLIFFWEGFYVLNIVLDYDKP